jgi:hypothetical protein
MLLLLPVSPRQRRKKKTKTGSGGGSDCEDEDETTPAASASAVAASAAAAAASEDVLILLPRMLMLLRLRLRLPAQPTCQEEAAPTMATTATGEERRWHSCTAEEREEEARGGGAFGQVQGRASTLGRRSDGRAETSRAGVIRSIPCCLPRGRVGPAQVQGRASFSLLFSLSLSLHGRWTRAACVSVCLTHVNTSVFRPRASVRGILSRKKGTIAFRRAVHPTVRDVSHPRSARSPPQQPPARRNEEASEPTNQVCVCVCAGLGEERVATLCCAPSPRRGLSPPPSWGRLSLSLPIRSVSVLPPPLYHTIHHSSCVSGLAN